MRVSQDGELVTFVTSSPGGFDVHLRNIVTSAEVVYPSLPSAARSEITNDHSSVIAIVEENAGPFVDNPIPFALLVAPATGGEWTKLADGVDDFAISPDSRIIAMGRRGKGPILESVARGPAYAVGTGDPSLLFLAPSSPMFEPVGGFDKALFYEPDGGGLHSVVGNADGSGDWLRLPPGTSCLDWAAHTAVCGDGSNVILVNGDRFGRLAQGVTQLDYAPAARKLYFVIPGGLHVADNPGP